MAGIVTTAISPQSCGHYVISITLEGQVHTFHVHPGDWPDLSQDELRVFVELASRFLLRRKNIPFSQWLNRVCIGEEASNVKIYTFFGPGVSITKTNIGTAYVNICPGLNGERVAVDFSGCTEYRLMLNANVIGTGQVGVRIVKDADVNDVLHDASNIGAAGEREGDTDWQPLPAWTQSLGIMFLRAQAKSTVGADDPVFRRLQLGLR